MTSEPNALAITALSGEVAEVWHYTTLRGLLGILRKRSMWATDSRFLNDPSEYQHALDVLRAFSSAHLPNDEFRTSLLDRLASIGAFDSAHAPPLICSFSATADDVTQWRSYADRGCGAALVFDMPSLSTAIANCEGDWYQCRYLPAVRDVSNDESVASKLRALVENWRADWDRYDRDDEADHHERGTSLRENIRLDHVLDEFKRSFKPNGLASEQEWRAVFRGRSQKTSLRLARGRIVPYRSVPLLKHGAKVSKVVVGPAFGDAESKDALQEWIVNRGIDALVEFSKHRLRP